MGEVDKEDLLDLIEDMDTAHLPNWEPRFIMALRELPTYCESIKTYLQTETMLLDTLNSIGEDVFFSGMFILPESLDRVHEIRTLVHLRNEQYAEMCMMRKLSMGDGHAKVHAIMSPIKVDFV